MEHSTHRIKAWRPTRPTSRDLVEQSLTWDMLKMVSQKSHRSHTTRLALVQILQQQLSQGRDKVGNETTINMALYLTLRTGGFGDGLNGKVCEAYNYLTNNYGPGDEIFIFGFSVRMRYTRMKENDLTIIISAAHIQHECSPASCATSVCLHRE